MLVVSAACGGSDTGSDRPAVNVVPDPDEGQEFSEAITVQAGGQLETPSGGASITFPPSAVADDVSVTLAVTAAARDTATSIYDFGPDGAEFRVPVTLRIRLEAELPAGFRPVIAFGAPGQWTEIRGSTFSDGVVEAKIRHFTPYSVVLVPTAPGIARVGLYNYNAIATSDLGVDLYVDSGAGPVLVSGDVGKWAAVTYGEVATSTNATFFVTEAGAGPTGTRLWEEAGVTVAENTAYNVIYRMRDPDTQLATAAIESDDLGYFAGLTESFLRIRFVADNDPDTTVPLVDIWDVSFMPPSYEGPMPLDLNLDVDDPQPRTFVGFNQAGAAGPLFCFDLDLQGFVDSTNEPFVWLFFGSDPAQDNAMDLAANVDNIGGTATKIDPVPCP